MGRSHFIVTTALLLFIFITVTFNIGNADAARILKPKHAKDIYSAQPNLINGDIKSVISKHRPALKNKLPSGPSPGVGHAYTNAGPVKAANGRSASILKNKLPSGPSPGVGHAYINVGPVKTSEKETILKNKLLSGPSPAVGHAYLNSSPVETANVGPKHLISLNELPSGPSHGGVGH